MENRDRFSAPGGATKPLLPGKGPDLKKEVPRLTILLSVPAEKVDLLDTAVGWIEKSTPLKHRLVVALIGTLSDEKVGWVASLMSAARGSDWVLMQSAEGVNQAIDRDLANATTDYILSIPVDCLLTDPEWFGKMQMPFTKDSSCGMSFAFDDMAGNTRPPHRWDPRQDVPGRVFMVQRSFVASALGQIKFGLAEDDYSSPLQHALRGLGLCSWAIPSVRLTLLKTVK
jgi:hypothetical protein